MISDIILNHLWQSTVFAATAALLTLLFKKNHAQVRYSLWFAASIKFLIPFSLFIAIGNSIDFGRQASTPLTPSTINIVETISRPFNSPVLARAITASPNPYWRHLILPSAYAMWLGGFLAVLIFYVVKSRRIRNEFCSAAPISQGRTFEALRHLAQIAGRGFPIKLASSGSLMEPGVFGIFRPVLLLPEGMEERLSDTELEAILVHEITHVRRRDNLVAAIQMFIEALFWFHPMVWWIGARLVQERERTCDEEVLRLGKDPQAYAEGILKVCEFYLESPLVCVSGVTGSDMKQRIQAIMTHSIGGRLGWMKKMFLASAAILALAVPFVVGLLNATIGEAQSKSDPKPSFEVVSIKPSHLYGMKAMQQNGRLLLDGVTLKYLITNAYGIQEYQLSVGPAWIAKDIYVIEAKAADPATKSEQMNLMLQSLLEERFRLKFHWDKRETPTYSLVIAKGGHKLKAAADVQGGISGSATGGNGRITFVDANGKVITAGPKEPRHLHNMTFYGGTNMENLANMMARLLSRPVIDKTGLAGRYEVALEWGPETGQDGSPNEPKGEFAGLSVFTAIQEQLGLKLEPDKGAIEYFVIDSVEKPSEN